jgi:hypothetical protein
MGVSGKCFSRRQDTEKELVCQRHFARRFCRRCAIHKPAFYAVKRGEKNNAAAVPDVCVNIVDVAQRFFYD